MNPPRDYEEHQEEYGSSYGGGASQSQSAQDSSSAPNRGYSTTSSSRQKIESRRQTGFHPEEHYDFCDELVVPRK